MNPWVGRGGFIGLGGFSSRFSSRFVLLSRFTFKDPLGLLGAGGFLTAAEGED